MAIDPSHSWSHFLETMRKSSSLSHIKLNKTNGPESISHTPSAPCESLHYLAMSKLPSVFSPLDAPHHPFEDGPTPPKPLTPFLTWRALEEAILTLHCLAAEAKSLLSMGFDISSPRGPTIPTSEGGVPSNPPQR
ncbi:hypothetical protein CK203_098125 [Vitis vinifera]|uniref:Uncharacterized protein n=1 Tax=Vitis vinifera TaxID=29760 RepID=A0A438C663_VITVI|nr:hypothetical protein CK203_098125 [Vitis vinifera]